MKPGQKRYYEKNRQVVIAKARAWVLANPEKSRALQFKSHLKKHYKITVEHYYSLLFVQKSKCAVCGLRFGTGVKDRPHVEHNHRTGKVRGLCCTGCNIKLGVLESPLRPALEAYLERTAK